jgi:hypothetical protein
MSLIFPYRPHPVPSGAWTLLGRQNRPQPVVNITVIGPVATKLVPALLDTGADETVFEERLARFVGVDLSNAPTGHLHGISSKATLLRYAEVTLRLTDGIEFREWPARVGFTQIPLRRALLGFAGMLQFFYCLFNGEREEVELTINANYPGT